LDKDRLIALITEEVNKQLKKPPADRIAIPVGVSNRHIHLSRGDLKTLFGPMAQLKKMKDLSQPGQFACEEKVILAGPKGVIENVRVLGPERRQTQVELSPGDCVKLGIKAPVRDSGDLQASAPITLIGPAGVVILSNGAIVATRHIHMHTTDAVRYGKKNGDRVSVKTAGARSLVFNEVLVRVSGDFAMEMHVDLDEANAAGLRTGDTVDLV